MERKQRLRLSQCMIVKNEEANIERALSWGKGVMWEQIVVDTGSTDRTMDIARSLGAKVCRIPWEDDFAAAKNYAIGQAKGDWIALLDADEYMAEEAVETLMLAIEEADRRGMEGLSTGWQQLDDEGRIYSSGTQVRFFKNKEDIRYRRRIHEQLESVTGRPLKLGDVVAQLSIFHTGYQSKAMARKTAERRNLRLIEEELREHPDDYEMMGYMGDEYLDSDGKEAARWYAASVAHMPPQLSESDQRSAVTFTRLLSLRLGDEDASWEDGQEIYELGTRYFPKEADLEYVAGHYWARRGEFGRAVRHLREAFGKLETYGCGNKALMLAGNLGEAYELMVQCCYEAGEMESCVSYAVHSLRYDKYGMTSFRRLLLALRPDEAGREAVFRLLSKLYDTGSLKDQLFLVKAAQKTGCEPFAAYLSEHFFGPQGAVPVHEGKGKEKS